MWIRQDIVIAFFFYLTDTLPVQEASSLTFTNWLYHTCFKYDKQGDKAFEPREMTLAEQRSEGGGTKKENQQTRGGGGRGRGGRGGRR